MRAGKKAGKPSTKGAGAKKQAAKAPAKKSPKQPAQPESQKERPRRRRGGDTPLDRKEWGYDPLLGLESIKTTMSGMLAELFARRGGNELPAEPPVDLYEEGQTLVVEMTLPGAHKQDIQMHAYQNLLIIRGQTQTQNAVPEERYHIHERRGGAFHRSIPLPYPVSHDHIKASLRDGVLRVTLPLAGTQSSRKVQVQID
jgi:HSP20 family protein